MNARPGREPRAHVPFYASAEDISLWSGDWRGRKPGWYYFHAGPDATVAGPFAEESVAHLKATLCECDQ